MKPVDQTNFQKGAGNCMAACLASLLEVSINEVPDIWISGPSKWWTVVQRYLIAHHQLVMVDTLVVEQALSSDTFLLVPRGYSIATGEGPRGLQHACVAFDGEIVHDPHHERKGLVGVGRYYILLPIAGGPGDDPETSLFQLHHRCRDNVHCWHEKKSKHAVHVPNGIHVCEVCCQCGTDRCRTEMFIEDPGQHGRFTP